MLETRAFKQGVFLHSPRKFGTLAEIMATALFDLKPAESGEYDRLDDNGDRVEIKFSRVLEPIEGSMNEKNCVKQTVDASRGPQAISSSEAKTAGYDCNIQQVKPEKFDTLIYGLFFKDKIEIFKIPSSEVADCPKGSPHQQRGNKTSDDAVNEGQFHITKDTIDYHRTRYKVKTVTYRKLKKILLEKQNQA